MTKNQANLIIAAVSVLILTQIVGLVVLVRKLDETRLGIVELRQILTAPETTTSAGGANRSPGATQ